MSVRGRDTLKSYFAAGELPTEQAFSELIESMLHMEDEGFRRSDEHGLHITSASREKALVTFFRKEAARQPQWTMRYGTGGAQLNLHACGRAPEEDDRAVLSLSAGHRVGVGTDAPRHRLHVDGVVGSDGRAGTYFKPDEKAPPLADGKWHVLADKLQGCVAFEVVASATKPRGGRHAVLHAMALNAHNPTMGWLEGKLDGWFGRHLNRKKKIRCQNAWWGERCDRLELQWQAGTEGYALAIRTMCDYEGGEPIDVHVTQLFPVPPPSPPQSRGSEDASAGSDTG